MADFIPVLRGFAAASKPDSKMEHAHCKTPLCRKGWVPIECVPKANKTFK